MAGTGAHFSRLHVPVQHGQGRRLVGGVVAAIEEQTGINGNPMQAFTNAIYQKFGVDLSKTLGPIAPGGLTGPVGNPASATVSTYGYEQPGDSTYDAASAQGEGAFSF